MVLVINGVEYGGGVVIFYKGVRVIVYGFVVD